MTTLNQRKTIFVAEYIKDFNATRAAIAAGYSVKTAESQGSRLLKEPAIREAIAKALEARSERTEIDADWVLKRAAAIVDADIADIIDDNNLFLPINQWPKVWRQMLSGYDVQELFDGRGENRSQIGEIVKVKLIDRLKAIELVGRHVDVGAFRDRVEVEVVDKASLIARARERASNRNKS